MKKSAKLKNSLALLYRDTVAVIAIWILIVAGSLSWNIYNERQSIQKLAKKEAHSSFKKDEAFRLWIASRGGVYVPLDERTPSNPYLKHPERDITTKSGKKLTLMNAAYVFGKVMEEHGPLTGVKWRLTSLKPTNPANAPDEWERKTLLAFEQDPKEMFGFTDIKGEPYLRLLSPLVTKKFCLTCHAFQGYKVGEIRGAVGVSVPMAPYLSVERKGVNTLIWTHGILLLLGLVAIGFVSNNSKKRILGRIRIEEELKKHKDHLEELVKERTVEIERTNESLKHEIIERKKAEEALRESEEKYRSMMEAMKDPIYICSQDFRVEYMNPAMIRRTGRDATGEHCFKALHDLDEKCSWCEHYKIQKGECFELDIVSPKDNRRYNISNSSIVHGDGSISKMTVFRDTTDLKKLEAQLQQASKMEAMGTLAGGIAHDFNNLLMAIQGRTSIMLMKKDSSDPDFGHLTGIEDNVESAADLTRQLLGFARGGKYEVRPTDLNELIKKQNRMFGRTKKEITIREKYEENLWSVEIDRGQIEQVLLNLYVNAWQAMPSGGDLYLETENVTLDENYVKPFSIEPGRYVQISVTDTGVGMDKATRERIFEPFFTTKEMGRGTGLGLASVYGIIKNHDGFINVYSEEGHGSTFNIYLPASEKEVIEKKKSAGDTLRGSETVLFVDDEDMMIEIAEELFEQLGYKVLTARSGKEAIEIYQENNERIDIVLLDMIMPDMSGSDTYDRMKKIDPDIKVLLFSGYSIDGRPTEIMDRGCNGFIQKPFKIKELSQKLREILDEK